MKIILNDNPDGILGIQMDELTAIYEQINERKPIIINFNFVNIKFVNTTFVLGLSVLITNFAKQGGKYTLENCDPRILRYFDAIHFPFGLKPDEVSNWDEILTFSAKKTYLPILNFSTDLKTESTLVRNNIISTFVKLLCKKYGYSTNILTAISYFISEYTDNIVEHSGEGRGWLFYQFFPKKRFVEFSIIDSGKSILGSYKDEKNKGSFNHIQTDKEALTSALEGFSTKSAERGRGLRTSRNLIIKGLLGNIHIASGKAMLISSRTQSSNLILNGKNWKGTVLGISIPEKSNNFDPYEYIN